jgi:hypothetical protein
MSSTDDAWQQATAYATKIIDRHRPVDPMANYKVCRCCQQRVHGEPLWPCDARKLAIIVLQRHRPDDLLA